MKSLKLIGLSLLAVFAMGVFAVASASAEEGFLTGGTGTPTTATILGGVSELETPDKAKIKCGKLDDTSIKFSNDKTATGTLHWLECEALGLAANSKGDKTGEILQAVKFLGCLDPKNSAKTLLDEFGIAGEVVGTATIEVPALGTKIEVKGTALGALLTTGTAKLFNVEFLGKLGAQTVTECLQGTEKLVHNLTAKKNTEAVLPASQNVVGGLIQFEKETEVMDS